MKEKEKKRKRPTYASYGAADAAKIVDGGMGEILAKVAGNGMRGIMRAIADASRIP